jgi:cysteine desulfurase
MSIIYFDHNSTTPILDSIKVYMFELMNTPLNPSSTHQYGRKAKYIIEESRRNILGLLNLNINEYDIVFTSSGTEANNLVLNNYKDKLIIVSSIEHLSIIKSIESYKDTIFLDVLENGIIDLCQLEDILKKIDSPKQTLVSIMYANNETGVIQPIKEIANLCNKYSVKYHTDAAQAIGKIDLNINELNLDFITISAHKFGGPIGSAALIYKKNINLIPYIYGGGQEKNLRSGTENVFSIKGMEKALEFIINNLNINIEKMLYLRNLLEEKIMKITPHTKIIGKEVNRLPNTSNIITHGMSSEKQLIELDLNNIAVSTGSACSSGKISKSHVLKAMKISEVDITCSIRISLGINNSEDEIIKFCQIWEEINKGNIHV